VITVPSHTKKDNPKAALKPRPRRQRRDRVPTASFPATVDTSGTDRWTGTERYLGTESFWSHNLKT